MPRKLIKRYAPNYEHVRKSRCLRLFGTLLHDPNLWHLNRRSVSGAVAVGLFWAIIPIPLQMVAAAATAILLRVNLPISVALVWISNPLTIPPIFYFCYVIGTWLMGKPDTHGEFEFSLQWIQASLGQIWQPLYLGSFLVGTILAVTGFFGMRTFWHLYVMHKYRKRQPSKLPNMPSRS